MKKVTTLLFICISILSCTNNKIVKGKFEVSGEIKNIPDQKIFLEQLYFSQKNPEVLDTGDIRKGKFSLSATAPEEGLYRLRMEKSEAGFIFINDKPAITFKADINDVSLAGPNFNSPANLLLKKFLIGLGENVKAVNTCAATVDSLKGNDKNL